MVTVYPGYIDETPPPLIQSVFISRASLKRIENREWRKKQKELICGIGPKVLFLHKNFSVIEAAAAVTSFQEAIKEIRKPLFQTLEVKMHKSDISFGRISFCQGAHRIRDVPNAGGSSVESEVLSFELFAATFGTQCKLLATEMEVCYFPSTAKKTDYTMELFGIPIGVSVTRAFAYRGNYTPLHAHRLLEKKLTGVVHSTPCVYSLSSISRQILHIWAPNQQIAHSLRVEWRRMKSHVRSNTIVVVSICDAKWLYCNPPTLLPSSSTFSSS